jgi:hypothetical protein
MISAGDVLSYLIPTGGWTIYADDFNSIIYDEGVKPITKKQFTDGFAQYEAWKAEQDNAKATAKAAILDRIGLTADELKTILG